MIRFSPKGCYHTGAGDLNLNFRATLTYPAPVRSSGKNKGEGGRKTSLPSAQSKTGKFFPKQTKWCRAQLAPAKMRPFLLSQLCPLCPRCRHRAWTAVTSEVGFSSKSENLLLIYSSSAETLPPTDRCSKAKGFRNSGGQVCHAMLSKDFSGSIFNAPVSFSLLLIKA